MKSILKSFRVSLPLILVSSLTLLLLVYVGFWEAARQNTIFQVSRLATQGGIVKKSVESYLQAGLPLKQYSGFQQLSQTFLSVDQGIEHLSIHDHNNFRVFFNAGDMAIANELLNDRSYRASETPSPKSNYLVEESASSFKIILPLNNKFGQTGSLEVEASKISMSAMFDNKYQDVFSAYTLIIFLFATFAIAYEHLASNSARKRSVLKSAYALSFLLMSCVIGVTVFQVYEHGAQANAKALTDSVVARLNSVLELGIAIEDIAGVDKTFIDYMSSNPDIRQISLIKNDTLKYHTDTAFIGKPYSKPERVYEYLVALKNRSDFSKDYAKNHDDSKAINRLAVSVSLPVDIVHKAILSSANEFIALAIACGLISLIFINASAGISGQFVNNSTNPAENALQTPLSVSMNLKLIQSAYFLIVFVHALSVSFLPNLVGGMADLSSSNFATNSLPFTLYYATFALILIPAGQYAEKGSLKNIMLTGCLLELCGLLLIIFAGEQYWLLVMARAISGAGQGLFLIGLQSYLLVVTPKKQRTQGAAVKVIGRNAGLISGTAIGALIFSFTDYNTVFVIGSVLSVMGMVYLWVLVPNEHKISQASDSSVRNAGANFVGLFHNIVQVFKDAEFVKSLLLIAMPGKMAITGVIMFATPLLLNRIGFDAGEIGQALMLYYIASIVMTHYASRLVDQLPYCSEARWSEGLAS